MRNPAMALVGMLALGLGACHSGNESAATGAVTTPKSALAQSAFRDCAGFREYYARALTREYLEVGQPCWGCDRVAVQAGAPSGAEAGSLGPTADAGAPAPMASVSGTNTQEAGVDESDVIEADGGSGRFYVLRGYRSEELLAVKAVPPEEMAVASRTDTGDHFADGMYLDSDAQRLVVVASLNNWIAWDHVAGRYASGSTQLQFYDLADPDHPVLTDAYEIAGYLMGSRRIGGRLHLVTSFPMGLPSALAQDSSFYQLVYQDYWQARADRNQAEANRLAAEIRRRISEAVRDADLAELLPTWRQGVDAVTAPVPMDCAAVSHPQVEERLGLVAISSIDTDGGGLAQMAALNNGWQLYASPDHLYLAQWSGGWWWDPGQRQQTALYRYRLDASGPARPAGHGLVDGWLHDRYGLSEHAGALRTATTEARYVPDRGWQRTNHLFVLDAGPSNSLDEIGAVRDFIRDESIFAARFLGERGYVVTFRVVDPLLTFDLSNPRAPRRVGELEVPGVATYLHPWGDDRLLSIGRGTTPQGFFTPEVQLQMFDVGMLASPQVVDSVLIGDDGQWAWSVAQYEPHAFTQFGDLLAVPVEVAAGDPAGAFSGFLAYRLDPSAGFTEVGRIDHKQDDDGSGSRCPATDDGSGAPCQTFAPVIFNPPLRSVVSHEPSGRTVLYTLSWGWLKAHEIGDDAQEIRALPLKP